MSLNGRDEYNVVIKVEQDVDEECELMAMSEISYVNRVGKAQMIRYPEKLPAKPNRRRGRRH